MISALPRRVISYFKEVKSEVEKIAWPTQKTTLMYSLFVIGACLVLAVYFGVVDFGLTKLVDAILLLR